MAEPRSQSGRGTQVRTPDLDWSQVGETVLMLELAAGQVDAAMRDSNASVNVLTESFTSLAGTLDGIEARMASLAEVAGAGADADLAEIRASARQVAHQAHRSIIAFQFYDRLMQRLHHVCLGLESLSQLVSNPEKRYRPREWAALQESISAQYTLVEERAMFDAVMRGTPVKEALEHYMTARMHEIEAGGGEVELF